MAGTRVPISRRGARLKPGRSPRKGRRLSPFLGASRAKNGLYYYYFQCPKRSFDPGTRWFLRVIVAVQKPQTAIPDGAPVKFLKRLSGRCLLPCAQADNKP
jgi:hypothetical protein